MKQEGDILADAEISMRPLPCMDTRWRFKGCHILLETHEGRIVKEFQERFKKMQEELLMFPIDCDRK